MVLDFEKYMPYLDEFDLLQDQKIEIMRTVWGMMESHVDQVFGSHPVQQASQKAEVTPLLPLLKNPNAKVITVSKHFENSANDNGHELEKTGW